MKADRQFIANQLLKLKKAYPQQPVGFFEILLECIEDLEFTEKELADAVKKCLYSFEYKNLTVAAIVKEKANEKETKRTGYNVIR